MFVSSPDKQMEWSDSGVEGSYRIINKLFRENEKVKDIALIPRTESKMNAMLRDVEKNIESFDYPKAIISATSFLDHLDTLESIPKQAYENLLKIFSPFCPHVTEELWQMIGNKPFLSLARWPAFDESKIDPRLEAAEEMINNTIADIANVLKLIKVDKPKKIKLIISPAWKYRFMALIKAELEKTRDVKTLIQACMKEPELKKHGQDISAMIPALLKDSSKIPSVVLSQEQEFGNLTEAKKQIASQFNSEVEIEKAEQSKEQKAKNASPLKAAIVIIN